MSRFLLYQAPEDRKGSGRIRVVMMGIHEVMPPGTLDYRREDEYVLMYFHTPAGAGQCQDCAGHFIVWAPGAVRRYGNPREAWDHSWVNLQGSAVRLSLEQHGFPLNRPVEADAEGVMETYFNAIMNELVSRQEQDEFVLEHLFELLIYELVRLIRTPELRIPERLLQAGKYMWKNLARPLSLGEIAGRAALSVPRFSSLFRQYYGEPPMQYLNSRRMNLAAQLLTYHGDSCKRVAERVGFADPLHFSRRFRQFWGVSPRRFRMEGGLLQAGLQSFPPETDPSG